MNIICKFLACWLMLLSLAVAQDEGATNTSPAASMDMYGARTQAKRIPFLLEVAQAYASEDDIPSAIGAYERVLEIDPKHQQARYILAVMYINAKEYKKAEQLFLGLAEEYPDDARLLNNLAWLYATAEDTSMRNGQKAVKFAQEAMLLTPYDYHVWNTLAEAYYVSGDYEKAYRAITHMANLITRYGKDVMEETVQQYNEQIQKCKRALDTAKAMKGEE